MKKQTTYLTALFLALWLPSQALATVLVHCVTHEPDAPRSHSLESDSLKSLSEPSHSLESDSLKLLSQSSHSEPSHFSHKPPQQTSDVAHGIETTVAIEDCHGKPAAQAKPADTSGHHDTNAPDCYHCTGGCHKLQPMLALERESQRTLLETNTTAVRSNNLAAGYPDFPIRPPITRLSV